jgi:hypothetical protein
VRLEPISSLEIARSSVKTTGYETITMASTATAASSGRSDFSGRMPGAGGSGAAGSEGAGRPHLTCLSHSASKAGVSARIFL